MSKRGRHGGGRGRSGRKNFDSNNIQTKRQELEFYLRGTGPYRQTETFTKVKEHLILNIQR